MYYLLIGYSQDCETQNEIVGVYSTLVKMENAIIEKLCIYMEIDSQNIDEESAQFILDEVRNVLHRKSTLFIYHKIEIDKDCNIQE